MPNSFNALYYYLKNKIYKTKRKNLLFNAFFIEGKNIGESNILLELANKNNILNFQNKFLLKEKI